MLRLRAGQVGQLWDEVLPLVVRELPDDLARIDELLLDPVLLAPVAAHWQREAQASRRRSESHGRPTIAIETYAGGLRLASSAPFLFDRARPAGPGWGQRRSTI